MSGSGSGPLVPTFHGFVQNSMDGLMLFEACLSGKLHHVPRRPHDRERANLIKSGSIFIYEENASGIKRWTDGVAWSPSRILGNFLIYRELEKPFPPGEKKRAMKRKRDSQIEAQAAATARRASDEQDASEANISGLASPEVKPAPETTTESTATDNDRELDRQLIGSLVDSYGFRQDGLVKKTMSISINGVSHHLVSYYQVDDVKSRILRRPSEDHRLAGMTIRPELYLKQNFRTPVEEADQYMMDPNNYHAHANAGYGAMVPGGYPMRPGQYMPPPGYPMYAPPPGAMYAPMQSPGWNGQPSPVGPGYPHAYPPHPYPPSDYYSRSAATPQGPEIKTEENSQRGPAPAYGMPPHGPYGQGMPGAENGQRGPPGPYQGGYNSMEENGARGQPNSYPGYPRYGGQPSPLHPPAATGSPYPASTGATNPSAAAYGRGPFDTPQGTAQFPPSTTSAPNAASSAYNSSLPYDSNGKVPTTQYGSQPSTPSYSTHQQGHFQ